MRLKCLTCEALARLVYLCAARSKHVIDVELFRLGLHQEPDDLRARLQERINDVAGEDYDAILLAYGLCGKATAGLVAPQIPLVIPRAHDCITLFLGDRQRYASEFSDNPGTYWYAMDYAQRSNGTVSMGVDAEEQTKETYDEYVAKYGKENATYLMEVMGAWKSHYNRAVFIDMGVGDATEVEAKTRADAAERGWTFERMAGDMVLIRRLLEGDWHNEFACIPPGERVVMTYDGTVLDRAKVQP